jgi:hypothetical protein
MPAYHSYPAPCCELIIAQCSYIYIYILKVESTLNKAFQLLLVGNFDKQGNTT